MLEAIRLRREEQCSSESEEPFNYCHSQASDREAFSLSKVGDDQKQERLLAAQLMCSNGEGEEILYRDPDMEGAPICARRYLSLVSRNGDDDMFSSDFSDDELKVKASSMFDGYVWRTFMKAGLAITHQRLTVTM